MILTLSPVAFIQAKAKLIFNFTNIKFIAAKKAHMVYMRRHDFHREGAFILMEVSLESVSMLGIEKQALKTSNLTIYY